MQLTTRLQVLFINDENDEGGLVYSRVVHIGDLRAACAYKYDFFSPSQTTYRIKDLTYAISEMFMARAPNRSACVHSIFSYSFAFFIIIIIIIQSLSLSPSLPLTLFFSRLSFPINLAQILVDEGYRRVIY